MQRAYYAIIPANVRYDKNLPANAKLLYGEITALCNEKGYCWASNNYFAELYGVSKVSISKWVNKLIEQGYLDSRLQYKEGSKEIEGRYLTLVNDPHKQKLNTPIKEKFKDNNTSINNTSNSSDNSENQEKIASSIPYKKIFDHLSKQSGKRVLNTSGNRDQVKARWNELKSITDDEKLSLILQMIDTKSSHAKNPLNNFDPKYLVVSTLFRKSNFAKYLEQDPNLEDNWELINKERAKQQNKPKNNFDLNELENLFGDPNEPEF